MPIAYDNSGANSANGTTSVSTTFTIGSLTNGILLIACADQNGSDSITTPTVGGSSTGVTLLASRTQDVSSAYFKVFYKLAPSSGSTAIAFTANSSDLGIAAITYSGVDQTTPYRTAGTGRGSSTSPSVSATTVSGDIVAEFFAWYAANGVSTLTYDGSQTSRQNRSTTNQGVGISEETASGTSTTASGTLSVGVNWGVIVVPLIVASSTVAHPLSGNLRRLLGGKL